MVAIVTMVAIAAVATMASLVAVAAHLARCFDAMVILAMTWML